MENSGIIPQADPSNAHFVLEYTFCTVATDHGPIFIKSVLINSRQTSGNGL
jgi:hypothetical protein